MKNKFNEKEFREKALLVILRDGMNEPKNACYFSERIKQNCVDSAKWGYYECYAQIENLLANNHEFGLGLDAGAADVQRHFEARDAKLKELVEDSVGDGTVFVAREAMENEIKRLQENARKMKLVLLVK